MIKFLVILSVIGVSLGQFHQGPRRPQQFQQAPSAPTQNYNQQDQYQNVDNDEPQKAQPAPVNQYKQSYQPQSQQRHESTTFIPIIRFDKEQGSDGSYKAAWETGNNILAQEEGFLKSLGPNPDVAGEELNAQVQQGSYTYTSPEGQIITVHYTADEKGFHPTGDHLPTPPPVSPEVQKGLDLIYAGIRAQQEAYAKNPQQLHKINSGQYQGEEAFDNNQYRQQLNQPQQQQQQPQNNNQYRQ